MADKTPLHSYEDDSLIGPQSEEWAARNATRVTGLLALVALAFGAWYFYGAYNRGEQERQTAIFSQAYTMAGLATQETETTKRLTMLRDASLEAQKAADQLKGTPLGLQALMVAGNAQFEAAYGQPQATAVESLRDALSLYDRYLANATNDQQRALGNLARANALDNLAFLTADTTEASNASKAYADAAKLGRGTPVELEARLGMGRLLLAQQGRESEARAVLESVVKESRALSDAGITKEMRASAPLTTMTVTINRETREFSQDELARLRRAEKLSLAGEAEELLKRLPALTQKTTGTLTTGS